MSTPKRYGIFSKIAAVFLFGFTLFMLIGVLSIMSGMKDGLAQYANYYHYEIVGDTVEKQDDGTYLITAEIKNTSAYMANIDTRNIRIEYGKGTSIDNLMPTYPDTQICDSLKYITIPAGQTVKQQILISPPEGTKIVRLCYNGDSYERREAFNEEWEYTYYTVNLT